MTRAFWKGAAVSFAAYSAALASGVWGNFRYTLFAVLAFQVTWTLFCAIRLVEFRFSAGGRANALPDERDGYSFALGGILSSLLLFAMIAVLTQVV